MCGIPYSSIVLIPWNLQDTSILNTITKRGFCIKKIKEALIDRMIDYKRSFDHSFPKDQKKFFLVPLCLEEEAFSIHRLKPAEFSALYLPSIALIEDGKIPAELNGGSIVAKDEVFSYFLEDQYRLVVDLSNNKKNFILMSNNELLEFSEKEFFLAQRCN